MSVDARPDFSGVELHTAGLRLRPLRPGDEAALFSIFGDTEVMRYWSTPAWAEPSRASVLVEADLEAMPEGRHLRLGLETLDAPQLVGTCSLFAFVWESDRAEIGYALKRSHWGRGLMGQALQALIDHAFENLALRRIEADIDPRNQASAKTLERLGFVREGFLRERWRVGYEVSDAALYGLLRSEWRGGAA